MNLITAKKISIEEFLNSSGFTPLKQEPTLTWYPSLEDKDNEPLLMIDLVRNTWYDFKLQKGGNIIDLVCLIYGYDEETAVEKINNIRVKYKKKTSVIASLPMRQDTDEMKYVRYSYLSNKGLLSYLLRKHIDLSIARKYCFELHYEYQEQPFFGLAFRNSSCGYEIQGSCYTGTIGSKDLTELRHSRTARCGIVCVFMTFLDFLSYLTISTYDDNRFAMLDDCDYVILNGPYNITRSINIIKQYSLVELYLTNDLVGKHTYNIIKKACGRSVNNVTPRYKDYRNLNTLLIRDKLYQQRDKV